MSRSCEGRPGPTEAGRERRLRDAARAHRAKADLSAVAQRAKAGAVTRHLATRTGGLRRSGRALREPMGFNPPCALDRGNDDRGVCRSGALSKRGGMMKPAAARNRALWCSIHVGLTLIDNGGLVPDTDGWRRSHCRPGKAFILNTNVARTFAALSATNEAILYAKSPEQLYQQVCEAAIFNDFLATAIYMLQPGTETLRFAAGAGELAELLRPIEISIAQTASQVLGLAGEAFRDQQPSISNDLVHDARAGAWREQVRKARIGAAAALPLTCNGRSVGALMVYLRGVGSLDQETVAMLARMAANVSFSLGNFEHEQQRRNTERAMERMSRMFAALSATNEAIMRAKSRTQLFEMVCEAAVHGAKFSSTSIALAEPQSEFLRVVASKGPRAGEPGGPVFRITESLPEGRGLTGSAFRTRMPCISNNYLADERTRPWHGAAQQCGLRSAAVLPLLNS